VLSAALSVLWLSREVRSKAVARTESEKEVMLSTWGRVKVDDGEQVRAGGVS
jgi:hypothetical protein